MDDLGLQDVIKLRQMMANSEGNEHHKRAEQHRLNAMLGLCEITTCRGGRPCCPISANIGTRPAATLDTCLDPPETWNGSRPPTKR